MKKHVLLLISIIFIFSVLPLTAKDNLWIGIGMSIDTDTVDKSNLPLYIEDTYSEDPKKINKVGPTIEISYFLPFFPYIGFNLESRTLLPVGVEKDTGRTSFAMSRNFDYSEKIIAGITGLIPFNSDYGLYMSFNSENTFTRLATSNADNDKTPVEYNRYEDYGMSGTIGLYTNNNNTGFFKVGFSYAHSLVNSQSNTSLTLSGGFIL